MGHLMKVVQISILASLFAPLPASGEYVNVVELDILPEHRDAFLTHAKENAETTAQEPGCKEFSVVVSAKDPNHVMLFHIYDNEATLQKHRGTEHFIEYQAVTNPMLVRRVIRPMTSVSIQRGP